LTHEILDPLRRKALDIFASIDESQAFYFTGGAALAAYYLRHRVSEDLDLFCPKENLIQIVARKFESALRQAGIGCETVRSFGSFWEVILSDDNREVRFQLALDSPFCLDELSKHGGIHVHGLSDLAAGKLMALFARAAERDFVDVFFLVKDGHFTMKQLIEMARTKDPGLDDYFLAIAFMKVEDLPDQVSELKLTLLRDIDVREMKSLFKAEAATLLNKGVNAAE